MKSRLAFILFLLFAAVPMLAQHKSGEESKKPRVAYKDVSEKDFASMPLPVSITQAGVVDYVCSAAPGNPPAGKVRFYCDSGTGNMTCINSSGANVCPGSGGSSAAGPVGTVQGTNGSGVLTTTGEADDGTNFTVDRDVHPKGPNPYLDITRYGARSACASNVAPCAPGVTITIANGANTGTVSTASSFRIGDGAVIYGGGNACPLLVPTGVTVTPSVASVGTGTGMVVNGPAGGATSYSYEVLARDPSGCLTAASASGTTASGAASLGAQSATITGFTRSTNTVTATTSAPHGLSVGAMVYITATVSANDNFYFGGWFVVATVPDNTHFTYITGNDIADGAPATSAGGGTAHWFNANHVSWTPVAGAFAYYIYGRTGGSLTLLGVSKPQTTVIDATWDDFGSPMMDGFVAPYFVPTTPPASPFPSPLVTTITGITGTTFTFANTATSSVSGGTILFDNTPNIQTAATQATGASLLYVPASANGFIVNSYLTIPGTVAIALAGGNLVLNDTMQLSPADKVFGMLGAQGQSTQAFGWPVGGFITVNRANFGVFVSNANEMHFDGIQLTGTSNAQYLMVADTTGGSQNHWHYVNFVDGGGSGDYMGVNLLVRHSFWNDLDHVAFNSGPGQEGGGFDGSTATPAAIFDTGGLSLGYLSVQDRGILHFPGAAGAHVEMHGISRMQGAIMPFFMVNGRDALGGLLGGTIKLEGIELDTMSHAFFAQLQASGTYVGNVTLDNLGTGPSGGFASVTGFPVGSPGVLLGTTSGQNNSAINAYNFTNNAVNVTGIGEFEVPVSVAGAPGLVASGGGSVPTGALSYAVTFLDVNGQESTLSAFTNITITGGTQTVTVSPPAAPAGAVTWKPYRCAANGLSCALANLTPCNTTSLTFAQTFTDTFAFGCATSPPAINRAGAQSISSAGVSGTKINLLGGGFADSISGTFTAARTQTLQDVTDTFVYRNSTDTLANKTLTSPVINGTVSGTALQGTDTHLMSAGTVSGTGASLCTDANGGATTSGCPAAASFYQTMLANASAQVQEPKLNFINGTNMTITCADNAGSTRTDCTFTSSATAATAFSAITAATNSNAGTFAMSGNTLDVTAATLLSSGSTTTNVVAPASPAAGKDALYSDSTDLRFHDKNASGVIGTTVVADAGASHNFLTAISVAGAISKAQPSFTDISGVATAGQLPTSAVNSVVNDTNVTGSIAGQALTLGWTGTLAKGRTLATTVYTDQANTYSAGAQDFRSAASLAVPASAALAPTTSAFIGYDTTANKWVFGQNGATINFALSSSPCAAHTWVSTPATGTATAVCTQPAYTDISGTLTAAQITNAFDRSTNNALGAHYFDMTTITAPANPAATNGRIYIDSSTNQLSCILSTGVSCFPISGSNANQALSNLSGVAINTSLLPGTDNAIDLGSATFRWRSIYFGGSLIGSGTGAVTLQGLTGTCTGLAGNGTLCFNSTGNRPTYDYNLGGFNNLVLSGVDINTSDQVTATHLATPLPNTQGGTGVTDLTFSGSTHKVGSTSGTLTSGNAAKFDASGNLVDAGVVGANLNTNVTNFTAGNLVSAAGAHSTQDSGIAAANVITTNTKTDVSQGGQFCQDAGASGTTYACSLSPAITAYVTGTRYRVKFNTTNTGASTINLNALGAKTIKKPVGGITTDIVAGDIQAGQWAELVYDGTNMQMETLLGNAPGSGTVTTTGTPAAGNIAKFSSASAITNGDLSGDATTAGTLVVTVSKINGTAFAGTTGNVASFGAANTPADAGFLATNVVRKDAANTGATGMTLDMSASTSAASLRLPNIAGASSTTAGVLSYDTTNKGLHAGANSVDNTLGIFPSTLVPVDGDCMIWKVSTSVITLDDRGPCPAGGSGTVNSGTAGNLAYYASSTTAVSDSGVVAANVVTNSTNLVSGNLVAATGNHTANDSGIASSNVPTAASNAGAAKQVAVSGGANKTLSFIDFPQMVYAPAADCVNGTPGSGWSTGATPAALCRAGTNNKDALLSPWGASDVGYFKVHLPNDWDSGASLDISIDLTSTDATNGHTIIMQASTVCAKGDGSTTDDVAFNAAQSFSTITLNGNANRTWNSTLTGATKTGCAAGSTLWIKISRTTDTATNVGVYGATVDVARLLTVQAN